MAANIHPTAIVDPQAQIGAEVEIGPFCCVGANVQLGDRVRLLSHVVVEGRTTVGPETVMYPFASIGHAPQDMKYKGEPSELHIGARNRIREYVTMNPGTAGGGLVTRVGDDGLFMAGAHVAHDCQVGHHVIMANNATLAGHVEVGDYAIFGGLSAVQQFVRIGPYAMVGGLSAVVQDVIPYGMVVGDRARLSGLNLVGLERRGFPREEIQAMRNAYRMLFAPEGTLAERVDEVALAFEASRQVMDIVDFIKARSGRALCLPRSANGG